MCHAKACSEPRGRATQKEPSLSYQCDETLHLVRNWLAGKDHDWVSRRWLPKNPRTSIEAAWLKTCRLGAKPLSVPYKVAKGTSSS